MDCCFVASLVWFSVRVSFLSVSFCLFVFGMSFCPMAKNKENIRATIPIESKFGGKGLCVGCVYGKLKFVLRWIDIFFVLLFLKLKQWIAETLWLPFSYHPAHTNTHTHTQKSRSHINTQTQTHTYQFTNTLSKFTGSKLFLWTHRHRETFLSVIRSKISSVNLVCVCAKKEMLEGILIKRKHAHSFRMLGVRVTVCWVVFCSSNWP